MRPPYRPSSHSTHQQQQQQQQPYYSHTQQHSNSNFYQHPQQASHQQQQQAQQQGGQGYHYQSPPQSAYLHQQQQPQYQQPLLQQQQEQQPQLQQQASYFGGQNVLSFIPVNNSPFEPASYPLAAQMGLQLGTQALSAGQEYVNKNLDRWVSRDTLKSYFQVSNSYVLSKLFLLLFPFKHQVPYSN